MIIKKMLTNRAMEHALPLRQRASTPPRTATVVAILGMHRSGTSWLAGSLEHLGLHLGEVNTKAQHNAKGNRENAAIREIHESVLRKNRGNWRRPSFPNRWPRRASKALGSRIADMSESSSTWGFKDPRSLLMLEEWHRQVGGLVRVGIYRHPLSVFRSLHRRHDDFTEDEAVELWRFYNERLLYEYERDPFPIIRFDVERDRLLADLLRLAHHIGLETSRDPAGFLDESLIHNADAANAPIPERASAVWHALEAARSRTR